MHLTRVRPLYEQDGPFVSLHTEVGRGTEDALAQLDARWTSIRHQLEHLDVAPALVAELAERLHENPHLHGQARRTVIASGEQILLDEVQAGPNPSSETVDLGALPDLGGWLTAESRAVPFLLVIADRTGADLELHRAASEPPEVERSVTGETFHISKVAPGDWAQRQFQQSAENAWNANARLVVDEVRRLAREHGPRAVLVAGDERTRKDIIGMLEEHQPADPGAVVLEIESGGRAAGSSRESLWAEVRERLRALVAEDDTDLAERLAAARGRGSGAVHGVEEVLGAIVVGKVDTLVLDLDQVRDKSVRSADLDGLDLPEAATSADRLPADRVLMAAAALTDAGVRLLPASMGRGGGASALLRWTDESD